MWKRPRSRSVKAPSHRRRLDHARAGAPRDLGAERRALVAVQLHERQADRSASSVISLERRVDEDAGELDAAAQRGADRLGLGERCSAARDCGAKTIPTAHAPSSAASTASSRRVTPQILALRIHPDNASAGGGSRQQRPQRRRRIVLAHQPLADSAASTPARRRRCEVRGRPDPRLGDDEHAVGDPVAQREGPLDLDAEVAQVAVVDADDPRAGLERDVELVRVVDLDEHVEAASRRARRAARAAARARARRRSAAPRRRRPRPPRRAGSRSTMKSLRSSGSAHAARAARRSSSEPSKWRSSVSTEIARGAAALVGARDLGDARAGADRARRGRAALVLGDDREPGRGERVAEGVRATRAGAGSSGARAPRGGGARRPRACSRGSRRGCSWRPPRRLDEALEQRRGAAVVDRGARALDARGQRRRPRPPRRSRRPRWRARARARAPRSPASTARVTAAFCSRRAALEAGAGAGSIPSSPGVTV